MDANYVNDAVWTASMESVYNAPFGHMDSSGAAVHMPDVLTSLGLTDGDCSMGDMQAAFDYSAQCDEYLAAAAWTDAAWQMNAEAADFYPQSWPAEFAMPEMHEMSAEYWDQWIVALNGEEVKAKPAPVRTKPKERPKELIKMVPKPAAPVSGSQYAPENRRFHKTALCSFFPKGLCTKGNNCTFAHAKDEMEAAPDLKKTAVCLRFKNGTCQRLAADCPFAHGSADLRVSVNGAAPPKQSFDFNVDRRSKAPQKIKRSFSRAKDALELLNMTSLDDSFQIDGEHGPMTFSVDEMCVINLEARESKESGADEWNEQTFGSGRVEDWDCSQRLPPRIDENDNEFHVDLPISFPPGLELPESGKNSPPLSTTFGSEPDISDSESRSAASDEAKC